MMRGGRHAPIWFLLALVGFFIMVYAESGIGGLVTIAILFAIAMLLPGPRYTKSAQGPWANDKSE